ncbi:MAG: aminopeptidase P N-terminal domain-containing protein [Bryobacteraceae bacterium]
MRKLLLPAIVALSLCPAFAAPAIPAQEYRARRAALRKDLDGTIVLFGRTEGPDELYGFIQEPNFLYLSGWTEPAAILLIAPAGEILFLPPHNERRERYTGKRSSASDTDARAFTGFDTVLGLEKFETELDKALSAHENVYMLPSQPETEKLKMRYPFRDFANAGPRIAKLRMKKSPAEIEAIQHSTDVSMQGHRAAWKRMAAGLYEYQLAATVGNIYSENGCERHAYAPIVGSGPNGTILHYGANRRRMDQGELVVMDTAAECADYASDITRTVPVSGRFTTRQRELYNIVLGAQQSAIAAIKPGVRFGGPPGDGTDVKSLNQIALDYMNSHGKDLHGKPLGKYFIHGLGHQVGLEVHDATAPGPLEAGMVITIEPGIYIPEEGIGIRIEDVVLVTANGARVLSAALPKEPDELEKALAR